MTTPSADEIRKALRYERETGQFFWLVSPSRSVRAGDRAGSRMRTGYIKIKFNGKFLLAHRVAWLHVHGCWPDKEIDHINRDRADNRIENLRQANRAENCQNKCAIGAKSKDQDPLGVAPCSDGRNKWRAQIHVNRRQIFLGHYDSPAIARAVYLAARKIIHPFSEQSKGANK